MQDQTHQEIRSKRSVPNDLTKIEAGTEMELRIRDKWFAVVIRGVSADRFAYQRRDTGRIFSSAAASVRQPARFRWPTVEGSPVEASTPMQVAPAEAMVRAPVGAPSAPIAAPPSSAAAPPPIVMNGEGATVTFENHTIPVYLFRGRACVIAGDLGRALGYVEKGLVNSIASWGEFLKGRDFDVLDGEDSRAFKAQMQRVSGVETRRASSMTVLFETGMDLACEKAQTDAGARLRRYLAEEVLPRLRRGEPVTSAPALPHDEDRAHAAEVAELRGLVRETMATVNGLVNTVGGLVGTVACLVTAVSAARRLPARASHPKRESARQMVLPSAGTAPAPASPAPPVAASVAAAAAPAPPPPPAPEPAESASAPPGPAPQRIVPPDWRTAAQIAVILSDRVGSEVSEERVNQIIRTTKIREDRDRARSEQSVRIDPHTMARHENPRWAYRKDVVDEVQRLLDTPAPAREPRTGRDRSAPNRSDRS